MSSAPWSCHLFTSQGRPPPLGTGGGSIVIYPLLLIPHGCWYCSSTSIAVIPGASKIRGRLFRWWYHLADRLWTTWPEFPQDVREYLCREWMTYFVPPTDAEMARKSHMAFHFIMPSVVRDSFHRAHQDTFLALGMKKKEDRRISKAFRSRPPVWITLDQWSRLCDHWMTDGWYLRSASGARNLQENQKKHCTGSVPTEVIVDKLSKKLDHPVSMAEVYKATHMKKDGTMIDEFSQHVIDTYTQILRE